MNRSASRSLVLMLVFACLGGACGGGAAPESMPVASSASSTAAATSAAAAGQAVNSAPEGTLGEEEQECHRFTEQLDRFVFVRLRPVLAESGELLGAPSGSDREEAAARLFGAARRLEELVDELDRMGVPPRGAADLLLSIRRGVMLYAAGFEKGGRGWQAGDPGLIKEAKADTLEAAAELNSYFGMQLCG